MYTKWTTGLTDSETKEFISGVSASRQVLRRLKKILAAESAAVCRVQEARDYSDASWPYLQADLNGEKRAYNKVLKLLNNLLLEE